MVELRVLGTLRLSASDGRAIEGLSHHVKRVALLAYLAAAVPRGMHLRDKLFALFWPELDQARARAALNQAVYVLRNALGEQALIPQGDGALGLNGAVVWCDASAFEAALDGGRLAEALALYQGDLLDGFFISEAPEFERWIDRERERLRRRAAEAAWSLAEASAARDAFEAARWARRAASLLPADEAQARRVMAFLNGLGDRAAAIDVYERFSSRLREEYDLEPAADTHALAATIRLAGQPISVHQPIDAQAASPIPLVPRSKPKRRWQPGARSAATAALFAVVAVGAWLSLRGSGAQSAPIVRFTFQLPADHQLSPAVGGKRIWLSPDGTRLAYLARGPQGSQLFLRSIDRVDAVPVPHTRGAQLAFFSPDGAWLGFVIGSEIRKVRLEGGPAITVCRVATTVSAPSWGSNVIVFATPTGLWQVPAAGGDARLLAAADTARGEAYRWPDVLPGGRAVVFTRRSAGSFQLSVASLATGDVVPLGLEGTSPHFITPGYLLFSRTDGALLAAPFDPNGLRVTGATLPVADGVQVGLGGQPMLGVSRTGMLAYFPEPSANHTLAVVDRSGTADTIPLSRGGFTTVRVSPDGRRAAVAIKPGPHTQPDLWVLDLSAHTLRRLTSDGASLAPVWSPDGRRIAFGTKPAGRAGWSVRWARADGGDSAETLLPPQVGQLPEGFTPDGRSLLFLRRNVATGWNLWTLPLHDDRKPRKYLDGPFDEHSAALSPDGRWLAYVSNESGQDEVYVEAFAARGSRVQVSAGGGREPRWARDGRELFYRNQQGMVAVTVATSASLRVGQRSVLFDDRSYLSATIGAAYDVHPDGRRFLMIRRGLEIPEVVVVLNWFGERRLAGGSAR